MLRILIAEDHELLRKQIRKFLQGRADVKVCGEAGDGRQAVEQARRLKPDLIVMDISMPGMNGLEATREILVLLPGTHVVVVSQYNSPEMIRQAMKAGAQGYVVKTEIVTSLMRAIHQVRGGKLFFDPGIAGLGSGMDAREITKRDRAIEKELREGERRPRRKRAKGGKSAGGRGGGRDNGTVNRNGLSNEFGELSGLLLLAQDSERRRIARELHDGAGQILAALAVHLEGLGDRARGDASSLEEAVRDCQELVDQLSREIRTLSYLLHPPVLDQCGLTEALRWYTRGLEERAHLSINLEVPLNFERPSPAAELAVFRVVQEALTNVYRHSGSKTATVRLLQDDSRMTVEIEDEGKGIAPERLAQIEGHGSGVGIRGMRERARQLNGELRIASSGTGTKISLSVPVSKTAS